MRLLRLVWTLGAVCAGLLAQPAQAQNAPPPPPAPGQFSFRVCNNSGLTLYFVFIYLNSVTDARFRTTGWYPVNAGECPHPSGNFLQGKFYYFAFGIKSDNTTYLVGGTVLQQCVDLSQTIDRYDIGTASCGPFPRIYSVGNYMAGFAEVIVPLMVDSITVSVKPPP